MDEPPLAAERLPRLRILIAMVVAIAFLMEQLDSTIIATAIPRCRAASARRACS